MIAKYNLLKDLLDDDKKKFVHFKSVGNFILNLGNLTSKEEIMKCETILHAYLDLIDAHSDSIDKKMGGELYIEYVYPLGEMYKKIGFIEILPLRNTLLFTLIFDLVVGLFFFSFPYPILTMLAVINYYLKQRKYIAVSKVFGMFY